MHKVEGVGVVKQCGLTFGWVFCLCSGAMAQALPEDEIQINFSNYFDTFDVAIIYPSVTLTKKMSESTSVTGRYLVDMVSAASIKNTGSSGDGEAFSDDDDDDEYQTDVDGVTSASGYGEGPAFDDVRYEGGLGFTQLVGLGTMSVNGIFSRENDYQSATLASSLSQSFAKKNTTLGVGFVRSWDTASPETKDWERDKNVTTFSANVSQVLNTKMVAQVLGSYTTESGYLADAYQQVTINGETLDPVHPNRRIRKAVAGRLKFRLTEKSSMQLGYRYYWDDWDVKSHTASLNYKRYVSPNVIVGLGVRSYLQGRASFFKPAYDQVEEFITTDIKLDSGFSNELQFDLTINGSESNLLGFLGDKVQYNLSASVYQRHSDTPYWFNGSKELLSTDFNFGIRYRF
ncbi:MAG: DUF3570 domain-containing protein [Candidatus Latescibacteria bacterium]|nr:DUF3570 domain-containing protein [Candidatus Latescibacterota bacterium]